MGREKASKNLPPHAAARFRLRELLPVSKIGHVRKLFGAAPSGLPLWNEPREESLCLVKELQCR